MIIVEVFEQEFYLDNVPADTIIEMLKQANFEVERHLNWLIIMRRFSGERHGYEEAIIKVISEYDTVNDFANCLKSGRFN